MPRSELDLTWLQEQYVINLSRSMDVGPAPRRLLELGLVTKSPWGPVLTPVGEVFVHYLAAREAKRFDAVSAAGTQSE